MTALVKDFMSKDVFALSPDTSLETASRLFVRHRITGAPVIDARGRVVGVISQADLVDPDANRGDGEGVPLYYRVNGGWATEFGDVMDVGPGRVADLMTPTTITIDQSDPVVRAAEIMLRHNIHRLIVTRKDQLVGVISTLDLLRAFVGTKSDDAAVERTGPAAQPHIDAETFDGR